MFKSIYGDDVMSKEQSQAPRDTSQTSYSRPLSTKLPRNYVIRDGFLCKGHTSTSLMTSGIVETAAQGFLHVDEAEDY